MINKRINTTIPEEVISLFLNKTQIKKLLILDMIDADNIPLKYLESVFSISKNRTRKFAERFVDEINSYGIDTIEYLTIVNDEIQVNSVLEPYHYIELVSLIRKTYVENSSLYRFLIYILENRNFTIKSIAEDIFYSESYIYKLISKIKILFSSLNLNIFLNKSVDNYILTGDELSIRYVHYFSIIRGNNFLSNETITSEVTDSFFHNHNSTIQSLSPAETARINCYSNIFSISINKHKYIHKLEREIFEIADIFNIRNQRKHAEIHNLADEIFINEAISLNYIISFFTPDLYSDKEKYKVGKMLMEDKNNPIISVCRDFLQQINSKYPLKPFTLNLLLFNLCNSIIVIHYLNLYQFMYLEENHYYGTVDESFVNKCIDTSLCEYITKGSYSSLKTNFFQTIASEISFIPNFKIYIDFFYQPEYKSFIQNNLTKIYNTNLIKITKNYSDADIVISDTVGYNTHKEQYYFKNIFDKDSWLKLSRYLNKKIIDNNV